MTHYTREGEWLVEVPVSEEDYEKASEEYYLKNPQYQGIIAAHEHYLASRLRLRISTELTARLGDRMQVTSDEIYSLELKKLTGDIELIAYPKDAQHIMWEDALSEAGIDWEGNKIDCLRKHYNISRK